jgi:hypothetical protein
MTGVLGVAAVQNQRSTGHATGASFDLGVAARAAEPSGSS